jgi:hypothetical protein
MHFQIPEKMMEERYFEIYNLALAIVSDALVFVPDKKNQSFGLVLKIAFSDKKGFKDSLNQKIQIEGWVQGYESGFSKITRGFAKLFGKLL